MENYSLPKAYRFISLLNCLGKTLEKIFATRLGYLANTTSLLQDLQLGGRKQQSTIDAVLLLLNNIQSKNNIGDIGEPCGIPVFIFIFSYICLLKESYIF